MVQSRRRQANSLTFKRRADCVFKKAHELSVLCDVMVCAAIVCPNGQIETQPQNPIEAIQLLKRFGGAAPAGKGKYEKIVVPDEINFLKQSNAANGDSGQSANLTTVHGAAEEEGKYEERIIPEEIDFLKQFDANRDDDQSVNFTVHGAAEEEGKYYKRERVVPEEIDFLKQFDANRYNDQSASLIVYGAAEEEEGKYEKGVAREEINFLFNATGDDDQYSNMIVNGAEEEEGKSEEGIARKEIDFKKIDFSFFDEKMLKGLPQESVLEIKKILKSKIEAAKNRVEFLKSKTKVPK